MTMTPMTAYPYLFLFIWSEQMFATLKPMTVGGISSVFYIITGIILTIIINFIPVLIYFSK